MSEPRVRIEWVGPALMAVVYSDAYAAAVYAGSGGGAPSHRGKIVIHRYPARADGKKYTHVVKWTSPNDGERQRIIHFGQAGADDYTRMMSKARSKEAKAEARGKRERYIMRHRDKEDWTMSGILTAGWHAYYFGWAKPSKREANAAVQNKFSSVKVVDHT